ncbi:acetoacetate--CoA ligase [Mariniluteicoccus endophyticus]
MSDLLWTPGPEAEDTRLRAFMRFLGERGVQVGDYDDLWRFSTEQGGEFWAAVWDFFDLGDRGAGPVHDGPMPGTRWFPGRNLSFAQQVLARTDTGAALIGLDESGRRTEFSWDDLRRDVRRFAGALTALGVRRGDRVVAYLPNIPQAIVALLGTAAVGAVWSAVGHDYAPQAVVDRFGQLEPKVLVAADGYHWGGKTIDRRADAYAVAGAIDSVEHVVMIDHALADADDVAAPAGVRPHRWADLLAGAEPTEPVDVEFNEPLWVLFSSGTTGIPKGIVHSQGGITLEQLKIQAFHLDSKPGEKLFWYTSPSWMMWNLIACSLLVGLTVVCYEGHPVHPGVERMWEIAEAEKVEVVGLSPGYLDGCLKAGLDLSRFDLSSLRALCTTGAPLSPVTHRWITDQLGGRPVWSMSGGTDICSGFCGGTPITPIHAGELSRRNLGVPMEAWNADGNAIIDEVGELVVTGPMPSMPVSFWNDPDEERYRGSYFDVFPGRWRHGDWVTVTSRGSVVIHGRSDSTLNRNGVRIGSAEVYRVVEQVPEVLESLVIGAEMPDGSYWMPLFIVLADGAELTDELVATIRDKVRTEASPRHVPDEVHAVRALPHTKTGKRLEVPIKRILQGADPASVVSPQALDDAALLQPFVELAALRHQR